MVRAVRQQVTVGPDGSVAIRSPELPPGARAEVIVLVESLGTPEPQPTDAAARLALLDEIQRKLNLTPEKTEAWLKQVREEREAVTDRVLRRGQ